MYSQQPMKRKRKRGGRPKPRQIQVVTTGRSSDIFRQESTVNKNNLITLHSSYENKVSKDLKIGLMNVQRVTDNKTNIIEDCILDNNFDMFFMTETWLAPVADEPRVTAFTPPSHSTVSCPRLTGQGGGISTTSHSFLSSHLKQNAILDFISFECSKVTIHMKGNVITIFCIYRPPPSKENKFTVPQFLSEFETFLDSYVLQLNSVLIFGDFNFHVDCPSDFYVKKFLEILEVRDLTQWIDKPTHIAGHTLDLVISKNVSFVSDFSVLQTCFSDHFLITVSISFDKMKKPQRTIHSRDLRSIDDAAFWLDLIDVSNAVIASDNKAATYSAELSSALDLHAPLRERRVTDRPSAPWMTSDILSLKADRRKAERRWRKSGSKEDMLVFKSLLFKFNELVKVTKKLYYEAKISAADSSKYLYGLVSHFCSKNKSSIIPDNVPLNTLPNLFIEFFTSKITKIRTAFSSDSCQSFNDVSFVGSKLTHFQP